MAEDGVDDVSDFGCNVDRDFAKTFRTEEQKLHRLPQREGVGEFSVLAKNLPLNSSFCIQVRLYFCAAFPSYLGQLCHLDNCILSRL